MRYMPIRPVYLRAWSSVGGRKEKEGPLGTLLDRYDESDMFGKDTFEKAEAEMQRLAAETALHKGNVQTKDVEWLFAGDLVNQCIATSYGILPLSLPFAGLFGACSTAAEGLMLSALVTGAYANRCLSLTSSHFCTAERQFRYPLEYGAQRPPTSQWTVTGAGAFLATSIPGDFSAWDKDYIPAVTEVLPGRIIDGGIHDANNMGAAMAPAALDTILRYFENNSQTPDAFDLLLTGDLGREGSALLDDLAAAHGLPLGGRLADCGKMIYRPTEKEDVHAGGSGCGCSAVVLAADILENLCSGVLSDILFIGTGALMNSMSLYQGQNIPAIAHLVRITAVPAAQVCRAAEREE